MYTAPSIAPENFRDISVTATSITLMWDNLTMSEANGIIRYFIVTCTNDNATLTMVSN